ncbi:zf-DHHC-domain-containing protein [Hygrophoropsis aurantiaca]|uniref:Zf-DHHC-domain-containing protein n=1 Tax=Hygrophoropsis aurantiaca TaxID=72124 RepID=A0ACB8AUE9_9AGAM|nr:zf-DHHC-domain-containing protein [Hygrophoropsis aurantiaca]
MNKLLGRVVIGFVLFLILFPVCSSQIFIIWPWYGRELTVELLILLVPFNFLAIMLLWNYYLCIVTDPGRVPDSWQPDTQSGEGYEVKKLTGGPRYCRSCEKYKPPRSHHCKQCNRCVLRMDHHCPWVNNCIGHFNCGHFIRFLFYVDVTCTYHLFMVTRRVFYTMGARCWDEPTGLELIFIIMNYVFSIPVLLAVGAFSLYHFYSLLGNTTTIEGWEKDKAATLRRRGKIQEVKFPYNLGARRNIASVLGSNPLLWCWPTVPPGTGLKYQLSMGDGIDAQHNWPPRDPTLNDQQEFKLPSSPWTYENGSFNPTLRPNGTRLRSNRSQSTSSYPPYHPDYDDIDAVDARTPSPDSGTDYEEDGKDAVRVRRGSEGYEIRPVDRQEMLRQLMGDQADQVDKYQYYVPEPPSDDEDEEEELADDDDLPLGATRTTPIISV